MSFRIAIDMDEVLVDTLAKELSIYNLEYNEHITKEDLAGKRLHHVVRIEHKEHVLNYPRTAGFFRDLPIMEGGREVLCELAKFHEIFITTAAMQYPTSFAGKYEWIKEHFPSFPDSHIVFCGDKSIIAADFLIDDNSFNFKRFQGKGLLFSAPHNLLETGYDRVASWSDVRKRFLETK